MKHGRSGWKRRMRLTAVLALLAAAPFLYSSCGGGGGGVETPPPPTCPPTCGTVVIAGGSVGSPASAQPTAATPDSLVLTIQEARILPKDGTNYTGIFSSAAPVDVVKNIGGVFGRSEPVGQTPSIPTGEYKAIQLTITEIRWSVSWSVTNPSPCDGATSGGETDRLVDLEGHTVFYFKTPDLGGNTLTHYLTDPNIPDPKKSEPEYVGDDKHPFVLATPIKVVANTTTTVNLILGIGNTLTCNGLSIYDRTTGVLKQTVSGDMTGDKTGLNNPSGVYVDTTNDEIGVANSGNDSITIYDRLLATGNVVPKSTVRGANTRLSSPAGIAIYLDQSIPRDPTKDEIIVANSGNDSITVYDRTTVMNSASNGNVAPKRLPLSGYFTGLSKPMGIYVDTVNNEISVANSGNDSITVYSRLSSQDAEPLRRISGNKTGLNNPAGVYLDVTRNILYVTNTGNNAILVFDVSDAAFNGPPLPADCVIGISGVTTTCNFTPSRIIAKGTDPVDNTTLNTPRGVFVDLTNDLLYVANSGTTGTGANSILVFENASTVNGNVAPSPSRTITGLNSPVGLYVDTTHDEIGVVHRGQQVVMASLPTIFPSGTNTDPSTSSIPLSGDYNLIFYGIEIDHTTPTGITIPRFFAERGTASFDSASTPWPSFNFIFDSQIKRRLGDRRGSDLSFLDPSNPPTDCDLDTTDSGIIKNGTYGVNSDGSFYAMIEGHNGTLQGTVLPDGSTFVSSMYDSPNELMLVYGVKAASQPPFMTSNGKLTGLPADYLFASYRNFYTFFDDFDPTIPQHRNLDSLRYLLSIGIAETGSTVLLGPPAKGVTTAVVSGDANQVIVSNPTGFFTDPIGGVVYRTNFTGSSLPAQDYFSDSRGLLENPSDGLAGALTGDGATLIMMRNTKGCNDLGFEMGLRASSPGSFGTGSLNGTYFTAAFGDFFDGTIRTSVTGSTGGTIAFDGAGHATMELVENSSGILSSFNESDFTYQVSQRFVPSNISGVQPSILVDVVDLFVPGSPDPYASALIGPNGQSLIFFRNLFFETTGTANLTRLLGLAVRQTPP